jgi:hypothetical protein
MDRYMLQADPGRLGGKPLGGLGHLAVSMRIRRDRWDTDELGQTR